MVARAEAAHELAISLVIRFRWDEAIQILEESVAELSADHAELGLMLRHDLIQTFINGRVDGDQLHAEFQDLRNIARDLSGATLGERVALQGIAITAAMGMDTAPAALKMGNDSAGGRGFHARGVAGWISAFVGLCRSGHGRGPHGRARVL